MLYANNKCADQPPHPRSLISAFVVRCLVSIILLVSISAISSLYLAAVAAQAGLCLAWSQTSKTGFLVTWLKYTTVRLEPACSTPEATKRLGISDIAIIRVVFIHSRQQIIKALIRLYGTRICRCHMA